MALDHNKYGYYVQAMRYFWESSAFNSMPPVGMSFIDFLSMVDRKSGADLFIPTIDKTLAKISQDKYKAAMKSLAARSKLSVPSFQDVLDAVSVEVKKVSVSDAASAAGEGLKDLASSIKFATPFILGGVVLIAVFFMMPKTGGFSLKRVKA